LEGKQETNKTKLLEAYLFWRCQVEKIAKSETANFHTRPANKKLAEPL